MLGQKAKDKNKLLDSTSLFSNLKDEERPMKQTTKVNLVQSQNTNFDGIWSRSGSSFQRQID